MNDGTIDAMRLKIITQLKANEKLKNNTLEMVGKSKVLNTPGAEKQTKRELFDSFRQELEARVLEEASKSVWELIMDDNGFGKEITETVEKVFCRLSEREPPLYPPPDNEKEKEDLEKEKESMTSSMTKKKKKRSFSDMKGKGGFINGGGGSPAIPEDSVTHSRKKSNEHEYDLVSAIRCSRTDGKSWQCFNMAVPDQKYCENHMSRGKKRLKKPTPSTTNKSIKSKKRVKATLLATSKSSAGIKESEAGTISMLPNEVLQTQKKSNEHGNDLEYVTRRCKITDGKNWQCYQMAVPDRKYCQKHLSRGTRVRKKQAETTPSATKKSIKSKKPVKDTPLATAKSSVTIKESSTETIFMQPNEVPHSRKKSNEHEYDLVSAIRCSRTDGKSWQCFNMAVPDQKYCENHMSRGKKRLKKPTPSTTNKSIKSKKRVKATLLATSKSSAGIKESEAGTISMLPNEVLRTQKKSNEHGNDLEYVTRRCKITDGKNWQCYQMAVPDRKYCQKHLSRGTRVRKKQAETTPSATKKSIKSKKPGKDTPLATAKSSVTIKELSTETIFMQPNEGNDDVSPMLSSPPMLLTQVLQL